MKFIKNIFKKYKDKYLIFKLGLSKRYQSNKQKIIALNLFKSKKKNFQVTKTSPKKETKSKTVENRKIISKSKSILLDIIDRVNFQKYKSKILDFKIPINFFDNKSKIFSLENNLNFTKYKTNISTIKNTIKQKFFSLIDKENLEKESNKNIQKIIKKKKNNSLKFKLDKLKKSKIFKDLKNKVSKNKKLIFLKNRLNELKDDLQKKLNNKKIIISTNLEKSFIGIFYNENDIYFAPITIENNITIFKNLIKVDIPTDVIGETKIENISEFIDISRSMIDVFGLINPKIILFLGSSFFTLRSFDENKIKSFSNKSEEILSKSPFLPHNTLMSSHKVSEKNSHSFYRVAYLEKESTDSWAEALKLLNNEIVTITCPIFGLIQRLSKLSKKDITIVCDIEKFSTTVYLERTNRELFNTKLPYGSSIYVSEDKSSNQRDLYFIRLRNSINQIIKNNNYSEDLDIYLTGIGLNLLFDNRDEIIEPFKRIPSKISKNYQYEQDSLKTLEKDFLSVFEFFSSYCEELK